MKILGIETSCDETAVTLIEAHGGFDNSFRFDILGNALMSQAAMHAEYGGVFPNLAKREHARNLVPLFREVLRQSDMLSAAILPDNGPLFQVELQETLAREPELLEAVTALILEQGKPHIDAIAVTVGPGLEPALWVGINFARALSCIWDIPIVAVNHMEGHIILPLMENGAQKAVESPMLSLLISGGHTELVLSREFGSYDVVGETRDDAAGEAFDKTARLLDLPYPGGPEISRLAAEAREKGLVPKFKLPRPMMNEANYDFSFSGLKTAVRTLVHEHKPLSNKKKLEIALEFEDAVADVLITKTLRAIDEYSVQTVVVGGGVSANTHIRSELARRLEAAGNPATLLFPEAGLETDNAIMIALAGYFHAQSGEFSAPAALVATGNLRLK